MVVFVKRWSSISQQHSYVCLLLHKVVTSHAVAVVVCVLQVLMLFSLSFQIFVFAILSCMTEAVYILIVLLVIPDKNLEEIINSKYSFLCTRLGADTLQFISLSFITVAYHISDSSYMGIHSDFTHKYCTQLIFQHQIK